MDLVKYVFIFKQFKFDAWQAPEVSLTVYGNRSNQSARDKAISVFKHMQKMCQPVMDDYKLYGSKSDRLGAIYDIDAERLPERNFE